MQAQKFYGQYKAIDANGNTVAMCDKLKNLRAIVDHHNANNPGNLYKIFDKADYSKLLERVKNDLAYYHI